MATVNYDHAAYTVATVRYDGTNEDEILTFVGANNFEQRWDSNCGKMRMYVSGKHIAVGDYVAQFDLTGEIIPRITAKKLSDEYTPSA
jgi:hypothetical protein